MRLARMGAAHQTRLSFLRAMLRRAAREGWRFARPRFDIDARGVGVAVYCVRDRRSAPTASSPSAMTCRRSGAPTASSPRPGTRRSCSTTACRARPRSSACAGTCRAKRPAAICRASWCSPAPTRACGCSSAWWRRLSDGRQPDADDVEATGYLMRTTAVYGNGKFGIADRDAHRASAPEFAGAVPGGDADRVADPRLHGRPRRAHGARCGRPDRRRA